MRSGVFHCPENDCIGVCGVTDRNYLKL